MYPPTMAFRQALSVETSRAGHGVVPNLSLALLYNEDLAGALRVGRRSRARAAVGARVCWDTVEGWSRSPRIADDDARRAFERVRELDARDVGAMVYLGQVLLFLRARKLHAGHRIVANGSGPRWNRYVTAVYNPWPCYQGRLCSRGSARSNACRCFARPVTLCDIRDGSSRTGRYAKRFVSTGAEPGARLQDRAVGRIHIHRARAGSGSLLMLEFGRFGRRFTASELG